MLRHRKTTDMGACAPHNIGNFWRLASPHGRATCSAMLSTKHGGNFMPTVRDFVEVWVEMRSKFQRQLKMLESGEMGTPAIGNPTEATIIRIKKWIDELDALLKECARADRT
jgi:hypothetical protein